MVRPIAILLALLILTKMNATLPGITLQQDAVSDDTTAQTIAYGTAAIFLAIASLVLAYLQLRKTRGPDVEAVQELPLAAREAMSGPRE